MPMQPLGDGSRVATGGQDSAAVWDVETGTEIFRVRTGGPVADVSGSGDGRRLLVIDIVGNVTVVDSSTGYVVRSSNRPTIAENPSIGR